MAGSNLPPGLAEADIPGNQGDEPEWEELFGEIQKRCDGETLDADTARLIWDSGLLSFTAYRIQIDKHYQAESDNKNCRFCGPPEEPPPPDMGTPDAYIGICRRCHRVRFVQFLAGEQLSDHAAVSMISLARCGDKLMPISQAEWDARYMHEMKGDTGCEICHARNPKNEENQE